MKKCLAALLLFCSAHAQARDLSFQKGVEAYMSANYDVAFSNFSESFKHEPSSSAAYNLGNTFYRRKELGQAIFWYRSALQLNPSDPDVQYNLNFARKSATDNIAFGTHFLNSYSAQRALFAALGFSVGFCLLYSLSQFVRQQWVRRLSWACLTATLLFLSAFCVQRLFEKPFGVLAAKQVDVMSGFGEGNTTLFTLHEGAEFDVLEHHSGSYKISVDDKRKGWIKSEAVLTSVPNSLETKNSDK